MSVSGAMGFHEGRYREKKLKGKSKPKGPAAEKSLAYRVSEKEGDWQG